MQVLSHLLAIFLGITVLPMRSLYHGLQVVVTALLAGIALVIGIPIFLAFVFRNAGLSTPWNFLITTLVVVPIATSLVLIGLAATVAYLAFNVFKETWLGLKNGLVDGMDGFYRTFANQRSYFEGISIRWRAFVNGVGVEDQINNIDDFNSFEEVIGELQDVVVPQHELEVPDMEDAMPIVKSKLLDSVEVQQVDQLIADCLASPILLSSAMKDKVELLKVRIQRYKDLSSSLHALDKDELIAFNDVAIPILLVKQYQTADLVWHSVPANSYVTDKDSLLTWLKTNPKHPLNREIIKSPPKYMEMTTRYRWHTLTPEHCSAQELHEGAAEIRDLVKKLSAPLATANKNMVSPGTSPVTLFGSSHTNAYDEGVVEPGSTHINSYGEGMMDPGAHRH